MTKSITAKDAEIVSEFKPLANMEKWLDTSIELQTDSPTEISIKIGLSKSNWYEWLKKPGFEDWYYLEYERRIRRWRPYLDSIGLKNAKKDYNYWKDMQKFTGRVEKQENNIQVNILNAIQEQKKKYDL
jgi:hypothetical protein